MYWLVLAALGDALTAILGCAGLLAGVWFIARGSSGAGAGAPAGSGSEPPATPADPAPAADAAGPDESPATTFRHGAIRLGGSSAREHAAAQPTPPAIPAAEPARAPEPDPAPAPEPSPAFVPPPLPPAPRTSFRQGRISLGGLERGRSAYPPADEPPDEA